jgi:hypothetical protein
VLAAGVRLNCLVLAVRVVRRVRGGPAPPSLGVVRG